MPYNTKAKKKRYNREYEKIRPKRIRDRKTEYKEYEKKREYIKCKECGISFRRLKKATNRIYCKKCREMISEKWQNRNLNIETKGIIGCCI
jgi:uncharacterized paraquat-inducible protein A